MILAALPAAWRPYAKAVLAVVGAVLATLSLVPGCPSWAPVVVACLTAAGVYQIPNVPNVAPTDQLDVADVTSLPIIPTQKREQWARAAASVRAPDTPGEIVPPA